MPDATSETTLIDEPTVSADQEQIDRLPEPPMSDMERTQQRLDELKAEFGDGLTELLVDVEFNNEVSNFLDGAYDTLKEVLDTFNHKCRFFLYMEPNGDFYVLRSLRPSEMKTAWLSLLSGQSEAFDKHSDPFLEAVMVHPSFEETAWDWEDDKMNAPSYLTKGHLIGCYFENELPDPNQPNSVAFKKAELDPAADLARRKNKKRKPSL